MQQQQPPPSTRSRQEAARQASSEAPATAPPTPTGPPVADDPEDDALEATRRQVEAHLADLEAQDAQQTNPRVVNWHAAVAAPVSTDESEAEAEEAEEESPIGTVHSQVNDSAGNDHRAGGAAGAAAGAIDFNAATGADDNDDDDDDDDVDVEDEDDEDESSSELELTIHGSPATAGGHSAAAAAVASAIASSGALWRQQTALRDRRSWHLFRPPAGARLLRRRRRQSADGAAAAADTADSFLADACKPAAFSDVGERNSVPLGSGLRSLALAQLGRLRPAADTDEGRCTAVVRVPTEIFSRHLLAECSIATTTAAAAAAVASSGAAASAGVNDALSSSRRRASWTMMRGPK